MTSRRGEEGMSAKDWEDECYKLREANKELQILSNDQVETIRKLTSKLRRLESDLHALEKTGKSPGLTTTVGGIKSSIRKEEEELIAELYSQIDRYKATCSSLQEKNKSLLETLDKKKKEIDMLKRSVQRSKPPAITPSFYKTTAPNTNTANSLSIELIPAPSRVGQLSPSKKVTNKFTDSSPITAPTISSDAKLLEIAQNLKTKLAETEERLNNAYREIRRLESLPNSSTENVAKSNHDRDSDRRLSLLQKQYDSLDAKYTAVNNSYKRSETELEEFAKKVRDLRRALEELRVEKDRVEAGASRLHDLEETIVELRQTNRSLEDKIAKLCEAPFIADAFRHQEYRLKAEELDRDRVEYKTKIDHLQEAVKTHYAALVTLKQQASKLREEKEMAEKSAESLRIKYLESEQGSNAIRSQLDAYAGEGVDVEALERALTLVKRRGESIARLDFLENPDGNNAEVDITSLKRKLQEVQIINMNLTKETERMESMLKLQSDINKDLHKELEGIVRTGDKDKSDLIRRLNDFENLAMKRLNKIHSLEAQIRQLVYGVSKKPNKSLSATGSNNDNTTISSEMDNNALLAELIEEKGGDINPDENLLEIWVKSGSVRDVVIAPGTSSFLVIDFFDYESQTTALAPGNKPQWDFAATFKLVVDDFLLRHFATDTLTLELNTASQGDFSMLARCSIPLSGLLKSRPFIRLINHPMLSVKSGELIAHVNLDIRLALPVTELYRLFLERHPGEKRRIEDISTKRIIDSANMNSRAALLQPKMAELEDESRLYNELEITIIKASGLAPSIDGEPPSSYIHFQLLGHPDKFTNPRPYDSNPIYNERFVFPMITTEQQLRLLRRSQLLLTVIDMKLEELDESIDAGDGVIGELSISLVDLADGNSIVSAFTIKSKESQRVGELELSLRWKTPLKRQRELGPLALSGVDVERILSVFASADANQVSIDYVAFCRYIDPPKGVIRAMEGLIQFITNIVEKENRSSKDVLRVLLNDSMNISEEVFINSLLKLHIDILPADLTQLYQYIDVSHSDAVVVDEILAVLRLDETVRIPTSLHDKLVTRVKELSAKKLYPLKFFEDADSWGIHGQMTRLEFKKVLQKLGFILIDEPDINLDVLDAPAPKKKKVITTSPAVDGEEELLHESVMDSIAAAKANESDKSDYLKQQTELFKKKIAEMDLQSHLLAEQAIEKKKKELLVEIPRQDSKEVSVGLNLLQSPLLDNEQVKAAFDPFEGTSVHLSGVANIASTSSDLKSDETALMSIPHVNQSKAKGNKKPRDSIDIVSAERALRECLRSKEGSSTFPELMKAFVKVDSKRTGFVNRMQFAHVCKQMEGLNLKPEYLSSLMHFFDSTVDSADARIDYNAFIRLCKYQPPLHVPSSHLKYIILDIERVNQIRAYDSAGKRMLPRAAMLKALADMGYGHTNQNKVLEMISFFETNIDGHVNYENFVKYILENPLCSLYHKLVADLKDIFLENGAEAENTKGWFAKIDTSGQGSVSSDDLEAFLVRMSMDASKPVVAALFSSIDVEKKNIIHHKDFRAWLKSKHKDTIDLSFLPLTLQQIQRKTQVYLLALQNRSEMNPDAIMMSFAIYDWTQPPKELIDSQVFTHVIRTLGFVYTSEEMLSICAEFATDNVKKEIRYKLFLEWGAPSKLAKRLTIIPDQIHSTSKIISILEESLKSGVDLISCFGRYDTKNVGRITVDEFCSALSDLGMSSLTQEDAIILGERFKASSGDFILYRRVVTALLHQLDDSTGADMIDPVDIIIAAIQRKKIGLSKLNDVFEYYDRKGQGRVRMEDVGTVFEEAGLQLRKREVNSVIDRYVIGDSRYIDYSGLMTTLLELGGGPQVRRTEEPLSEEISGKIKRFLESLILRGVDFRRELDILDETHSGVVLQASFKDTLVRLKLDLSEKEWDSLINIFRESDDIRRVNYVKFLTEMHPNALSKLSVDYFDRAGAVEAAEELRRLVRRRCDFLYPGELKRPWRHFAGKTGKEVGLKELSVGLKKLGMTISAENERILLEMISFDEFALHDKVFSYPEFLVFVRDPNHRDVVWKFRRLVTRAGISEKEIMLSLKEQDTNDAGLLTIKQFNKALSSCSIQLSDSDVTRLLTRFDEEDNMMLSIGLFMSFLRGGKKDSDILTASTSTRPFTASQIDISSPSPESDLTSWNLFKERVEDRLYSGFTEAETYAMFCNGAGSVDLATLHSGARELGLAQITRAEIRSILKRMCFKVGAILDSDSFLKALGLRSDDYRGNSAKQTDLKTLRSTNKDDLTRLLLTIKKDLEGNNRGKDIDIVLEKVMKSIDIDNDGAVTLREFSKALDTLSVQLEEDEINIIFSHFSKPLQGTDIAVVNIQVFKESVMSLKMKTNRSVNSQEDIQFMFERYRVEAEDSYGSASSAAINFHKAFADEVGDEAIKLVTLKQFQRVLKSFNLDHIKYHRENSETVFRYFDIDDKDLIDFTDFLLTLFPSKNIKSVSANRISDKNEEEDNAQDVDDLLDRIRRKVEDSFSDGRNEAYAAFKDALVSRGKDKKDKSTLVDKKTFKLAMEKLHADVSSQEVDVIFNRYVINKPGSDKDYIDYDLFIENLKFPKISRRSGNGGESSSSRK